VSATKKVVAVHGGFVGSQQACAELRTPWPWPQAVLAIILLSVLLWGGIAAIALVAFS
jgi:hypothetical protein